MFVLMLFCVLFLLCLTCNIFIISWILKFCTLISVIIVFWSDWLIIFLITCLIMIIKWVLITQILNFRAVTQLIFFIMRFFVSTEFSISIIFLLESFLAVIIFSLLLFLIFVFIIFIIFVSLIFFVKKQTFVS